MSSSDDETWEQVPTLTHGSPDPTNDKHDVNTPTESLLGEEPGAFDIVVQTKPQKKQRSGVTKFDRIRQLLVHQTHLLCLLKHGVSRNRWCDDEETRAKVYSLLSSEEMKVVKSKEGLMKLVAWWRKTITLTSNDTSEEALFETHQASSELFVQAFVALCRALGFETRLVWSLQPIPLNVARAKKTASMPTTPVETQSTETITKEECDESQPKKKRRVSKVQPKVEDSPPPEWWIEVLLDKIWVACDPFRERFDCSTHMEQPAKSIRPLHYVTAFYPDSDRIRDVTRRYTTDFLTTTIKLRSETWWFETISMMNQGLPPHPCDEAENKQLEESVSTDSFPKSISSYLNHPKYVLERHLKKFEIIYPMGTEHALGQIRGENIYPRANVHMLHTADKWLSLEAKSIKPGEEPVKFVKSRVKPSKKSVKDLRHIQSSNSSDDDFDVAQDSQRQETPMVGVYGEWQTELYEPPDIPPSGIVPRNGYNNFDLFHPRLLPCNAAHVTDADIPLSQVKKIATELGIDFAEAVVGFDVKKGRMVPRVDGVVVAAWNKQTLLDAWMVKEQEQVEKTIKVTQKNAIARWEKLTRGMLIRARLYEQHNFNADTEHDGKAA